MNEEMKKQLNINLEDLKKGIQEITTKISDMEYNIKEQQKQLNIMEENRKSAIIQFQTLQSVLNMSDNMQKEEKPKEKLKEGK